MKRIDKVRAAEWVLAALLLCLCWFGGEWHGRETALAKVDGRTDTVTKIVTAWRDFPEPQKTAQIGYVSVPAVYFLTDTINAVEWREIAVHDTTVVYLPREQKYYAEEDGRLRLWVSGYEPRLDRYELDAVETTITQTLVERHRWGLGVTAGYGCALHDKAVVLSPFVGIGISYSFLTF